MNDFRHKDANDAVHASDDTPQMPPSTHSKIVETVGDELVVYTVSDHQVHLLNPIASEIFKRCDGVSSFDDTASHIAKVSNLDVKDAEAAVCKALEVFAEKDLLGSEVSAGINRRQLLTKLATAAAMLPIVTSIVAPRSAHAASCTRCIGTTGSCNVVCDPTTGSPSEDCIGFGTGVCAAQIERDFLDPDGFVSFNGYTCIPCGLLSTPIQCETLCNDPTLHASFTCNAIPSPCGTSGNAAASGCPVSRSPGPCP